MIDSSMGGGQDTLLKKMQNDITFVNCDLCGKFGSMIEAERYKLVRQQLCSV